jgi:hypothetical protein
MRVARAFPLIVSKLWLKSLIESNIFINKKLSMKYIKINIFIYTYIYYFKIKINTLTHINIIYSLI